jgi:uncharacterized protein DUF4440
MKTHFFLRNALRLLTLCTVSFAATAQAPATDPLYVTVSGLDTALFNAYNHCELEKLGAMAADDLEFYHDQTGLSVGKQSLIDGVKNNICGKVQRELVPGSLEVYPLKGYGAVEIGVHRFHHPGQTEPDTVGEAKFVMIWQLKDGIWKLTRVISFNHFALPSSNDPKPAAK